MSEYVLHNVSRSATGNMPWCYQYTNDDAPAKWTSQACGQAACATAFSTSTGVWVSDFSGLFSPPWNPDTNGLGTTPWRMKDILQMRFKVQIANIYGVDQLSTYLKNGNPVIVALDLKTAKADIKNFALHWVCVYGFTDYNFLLSNFSYPGYENDIEGVTTCNGPGSNVCPKALSSMDGKPGPSTV